MKVGRGQFLTGHTYSASMTEKLREEMEVNKRETNQVVYASRTQLDPGEANKSR